MNITVKRLLQNVSWGDPAYLEAPDKAFIGHRDILTRNMARYHFVKGYVSGDVLDIGCGRGYGFDLLRKDSNSCIGIDIAESFLNEAASNYPDISFTRASGDMLPFNEKSFDSIIAFEVIEHLVNDDGLLKDVVRVSRPGAFIAISTPNRIYSSGRDTNPLNKFHVREYIATEFLSLLNRFFSQVELYGQYEEYKVRSSSQILDLVPIKMKYMLPIHLQGLLSILIRPPLTKDECKFSKSAYDKSHTLVALCRV